MSEEDRYSPTELEWLIEDRKRRIEDVEKQLSEETDEDVASGLKGMLRMLREETEGYERKLAGAPGNDEENCIRDIDSKIRDIDLSLKNETDPVIRNNLEVSKRFLQMERNHALVEMTHTAPEQENRRTADLERRLESSIAYASDLKRRLERAEKEASYYRNLAEHPERGTSCDTVRVTVEAGTLKDLRNSLRTESLENERLNRENTALKEQISMLRKNVSELTVHCKEADTQILILQERLARLRREMDRGNAERCTDVSL